MGAPGRGIGLEAAPADAWRALERIAKRPLVALGAAALALTLVAPGGARTDGGGPQRYVVVFTGGSGLPANASKLVSAAGGTVTATLPQLGAVRASSARGDFAAAAASIPQVAGVGVDAVRQLIPSDDAGGSAPRAAAAPSSGGDPLSGQQWDKARIGATASGSYAVQRGRRDVVVAVLDTGADTSHPDIAPNLDLARSRSFVPSELDLQDHNGHGTWCLSAVAAPLNGVGIAGVAPNVTTLALKVLDRNGDGSFSGIAQALVYAADQHANVASLSLGACGDRRFQPPGAGIHGGGRVLGAWPAEAIASIDPSLREQDCGAGGCADYAWEQGTSMAVPDVAGVAALVVSQLGHPHMRPDDVEKVLERSASPLPCPAPPTVTYDVPPGILASNTATCRGNAKSNGFYGSGLVDALRAVSE